MRSPKPALALLVGMAVFGGSTAAFATMPMQKKAKESGFPAENCMYCHVDKMPKKGAAAENDRGKFLVDQKTKKKATEVDVTWLKEYVEPKK
jgi:hypothetical protein